MSFNWTRNEIYRAQLLRAQGLSYQGIANHMGRTRNAVCGLFLRLKPQKKREPSPRIESSFKHICLANGCLGGALVDQKFCDRHAFKPRTDQPMNRLMGARA